MTNLCTIHVMIKSSIDGCTLAVPYFSNACPSRYNVLYARSIVFQFRQLEKLTDQNKIWYSVVLFQIRGNL